jgi:hypothetical protein
LAENVDVVTLLADTAKLIMTKLVIVNALMAQKLVNAVVVGETTFTQLV